MKKGDNQFGFLTKRGMELEAIIRDLKESKWLIDQRDVMCGLASVVEELENQHANLLAIRNELKEKP